MIERRKGNRIGIAVLVSLIAVLSLVIYANNGVQYLGYIKSIYRYYAVQHLQKKMDMEYAKMRPNFARAYMSDMKGDYDTAIKEYTKTIEIYPYAPEPYFNRAVAYEEKGEHQLAINDYTKSIEIKPGQYEAYLYRGEMYQKLKDFVNAEKDFAKCIELNSSEPDAYCYRGQMYEEMGNNANAEKDYEKYRELYYKQIAPLEDLDIQIIGPKTAEPGESLTYRFNLQNNGNRNSGTLQIRFVSPVETRFVHNSSTYSYHNVGEGNWVDCPDPENAPEYVEWLIPEIAPGASYTVDAKVKVKGSVTPDIVLNSVLYFMQRDPLDNNEYGDEYYSGNKRTFSTQIVQRSK